MLHGKLLRSPLPHARIVRIDTTKAAAHPGVHLVLTGESFPIRVRRAAGEPRRTRAVPGQGAVRRRSGRGRRRARRSRPRPTAIELIDVEYEPLRTIATPEESLAHPEPRIHDYGDDGNIHKAVALQFGDVDAALAEPDHVFDDVFFFEGNTHLPHRAARGGGGEGSGRQARRLLEHADAALPASRARQGAGDAGGAHPRDRDAQRRRLRRQERPVQPRGRRREGGVDARPAGQDLPDARRGLLLPSRPPSRADAIPDGRDQRRTADGPRPARRCSMAARTDRTASPARSTRARCRR